MACTPGKKPNNGVFCRVDCGLGFFAAWTWFFAEFRWFFPCTPYSAWLFAEKTASARSKNDSAGLAGEVKKNTSAKNSKNSAVTKITCGPVQDSIEKPERVTSTQAWIDASWRRPGHSSILPGSSSKIICSYVPILIFGVRSMLPGKIIKKRRQHLLRKQKPKFGVFSAMMKMIRYMSYWFETKALAKKSRKVQFFQRGHMSRNTKPH